MTLRLTRAQVREVDRLSIERHHIPGIVLMENAARAATAVAMDMLGPKPRPTVLILCGGGNNGGDGLAVARHLHNRGADVYVWPQTDPAKYAGDALLNWQIVETIHGITLTRPSLQLDALFEKGCDLVIDAVFGTGLRESPRPPFDSLVETIESQTAPVLAIDLPSGMDCDTGEPLGPCVRATRTITFVAEKAGFANPNSYAFTGEVHVGDIGCPVELIEEVARTR